MKICKNISNIITKYLIKNIVKTDRYSPITLIKYKNIYCYYRTISKNG